MTKTTIVTPLDPPKGCILYQRIEILQNGKATNTFWLWETDPKSKKVKKRIKKGIEINLLTIDTPDIVAEKTRKALD